MVKIDFSFDSVYGRYNDALILADQHTLSPEEIEQLKQERFNAWLAVLSASSNTSSVDGFQVNDAPPAQEG